MHPSHFTKKNMLIAAALLSLAACSKPAPEEAAKPKLAYILHRGSESAANQSYRRMSDFLHKRDP